MRPETYKRQSAAYDILIESLLVFLLVFTPLAYGAVHPWSIAIFEAAAALMAMLWVFKMLSTGKFEFIHTPLTYFIPLFILYVSFQLVSSSLPSGAGRYPLPNTIYQWATKTEILKLAAYAFIFIVTLNTLRTKAQIRRTGVSIITTGFFMGIFYLMRYFGAPAPAGFINPDHFCAYLGMIILLSLGFLLVPFPKGKCKASSQGEGEASPKGKSEAFTKGNDIRLLLFFCTLIMSAALVFTMSRGGMFSFIAALLFIALLVSTRRSIKKKGWIIVAIAVFIVLIVAWLGAAPVVERILSVRAEVASRYFGGRVPIWQGTIGIIKDNSLFGTGLGTFNYIFPKYQPVGLIAKHYTYAHSDVLELLSEVGIVGFALALAGGLWSIVSIFRRYLKRHDPWVTAMSICVFGSLASIFIHSFTDFSLHIPANAVLLTILLSLLISILNTTSDMRHTTECEASVQGECGSFPLGNDREQSLPVSGIIGYPVAVIAAGLLVVYAIAVVRPAMADHYANTAPADQQGIEAAIRLDPANAEYHYKLARLYGKSGMYALQLAAYQDAARLNPTNSQYHQSLAWAYGQMKNVSKARQEFEAAIALNPNYYYPYQVYAMWLFNHPTKENIGQGVVTYKKAITLNTALAKEALDKYRAYQNDYVQLLNISPGTKGSDGIFLRYLLAEENIDYAIQFAERFLKSYKENAECYFWIADKASHDNAYGFDFAQRFYKKSIELEPDNAFYRYWYAVNLARRKDRIESDKQFNLIVQSHPEYSEKIQEFRLKMYE